MLDPEDQTEDKGLFTFYREQAEREDQIKREKKNKKKKKEQEIALKKLQLQKQIAQAKPVPIVKISPARVVILKEVSLKPKISIPKQRLIESIVDMGKQMQDEQQANQRSNSLLRYREPSFIHKNRKYQQRINELKSNRGYEYSNYLDDGIILNQIHFAPFHKRNQSEDHVSIKNKQAIHSARDSVVELPDIRKSDEGRVPYRPKKSIKSKMIQEAMHTRDRSKIKQIRQYLKFSSPRKDEDDEEEDQNQFQVDDTANFEIFELRQQKLLGILKRFHKGY